MRPIGATAAMSWHSCLMPALAFRYIRRRSQIFFATRIPESDMGNSADDGEFIRHYGFLLNEMARVTMPGRLSAVHCSDLPLKSGRMA